jgi:cytochrome oxidase Cu insertion factor (SCO1/SenC/PrrC family)
METTSQDEAVQRRSFYRSPRFFAGCVLWLGVIAAVVWMQATGRNRGADAARVGEVGKNTPVPDEAAGQKSLVIKTNKDGGLEVVDAATAKAMAESPWDNEGIADFEFIDTEGKTVKKADLLGKPWIVCFVFTHCAATCPMVTNSMRELQDRLKDCDFRLVTLTVDPERDTPEVLKGYGESRGADFSKWMFLGGDKIATYKLIHGSFKMPVQETVGKDRQPGYEFIHSNNIMLVDAGGVVRGKFDATKGEAMSSLRREVQKLTKGDAEQDKGSGEAEVTGSPKASGVEVKN